MRLKRHGAHIVFLFCTIIISSFSVFMSSAAVVTLDSIEIFRTHEWLKSEPTVYFKCKGENLISLPDVKQKHLLYSFKGEESWQPLTNLTDKKCKRCGFYEHDAILSDDVFDEWEFCASDFTRSDGKYVRHKDKEFNATFLCLECVPLGNASTHTSSSQDERKPLHWILVTLICGLVILIISGAAVAYKYWQKRKKQQEQARFLKLFEDNDDIEDELGIGPLSHVI